MALLEGSLGHLLRRAGFGVSSTEASFWKTKSVPEAIDLLVDYEAVPDDVDAKIGQPNYLPTVCAKTFNEDGILVASSKFDPNGNLVDAMQRWVFRMAHSRRPLQEKMTLFWHDHFATGRSKIIQQLSFPGAVRAFAAKPSEDPDGATGQIELFRVNALGNFRSLLHAVSRDVAMICWLDGDTNRKGKPQENFSRELMELFTIGADQFVEEDVYAGARVFTGWNLEPVDEGAFDVHYRGFRYYPEAHDTGEKTFSFPIYPDGGRTIPARRASDGYQDGLDLLNALAAHPATGAFLARKLYAYFVTDQREPDPQLIASLAATYYSSGFEIREVVRALLRSSQFQDPASHWARYSWPAEYVVRLLKEVGWEGYTAESAVYSMIGMGQTLFDPPNVGGWRPGRSWFSTTTMLARMNFAMDLCSRQQAPLEREAASLSPPTAESLLKHFLGRMSCKPFDESGLAAMRAYLSLTPATGTPTQLAARAAGLVHLIGASGECQFQ